MPEPIDYHELFRDPDLWLMHHKMFQHTGPRSEETDAAAQELARCAMERDHPGVQDITFTWVHHNIPDVWLLFVRGGTRLKGPAE